MRVGLHDNLTVVDRSIALLRHYEPPEGYYLAFSGGKDSIAIYRLAQMAGVQFDAHYSVTTIDPPELVQFIRREYPEVRWERSEHTMYWHIEQRGLPTRRGRWCCDEFKERHGSGRLILTGIRADESAKRSRRPVLDPCLKDKRKTFLHAIRDWSTGEVWEFIRVQGLRYCSLYDEGFHRIGCVMCPFERKVKRSMARWPRIWENCRKAFQRRWDAGLNGDEELEQFRRWPTADAAFEWWCGRDTPYPQRVEDREPELPGMFT